MVSPAPFPIISEQKFIRLLDFWRNKETGCREWHPVAVIPRRQNPGRFDRFWHPCDSRSVESDIG